MKRNFWKAMWFAFGSVFGVLSAVSVIATTVLTVHTNLLSNELEARRAKARRTTYQNYYTADKV